MELKSLRLITNILQEEIKTLRNQHEDKEALRKGAFSRCKNKKVSEVQCSNAMSEQVTREITVPQWSEAAAGRRKIRPHTRYSEAKSIPVMHNRYEVLNNCCINMWK